MKNLTSEAPQMFLIEDKGNDGKGWKWPSERSAIQECYALFMDWANSTGIPTGDSQNDAKYYWYTQPPKAGDPYASVYTRRP